MREYSPSAESGSYCDMWTWTNPQDRYRLIAIGQDASVVRRFAMWQRDNLPTCFVLKVLLGPWLFLIYHEKAVR